MADVLRFLNRVKERYMFEDPARLEARIARGAAKDIDHAAEMRALQEEHIEMKMWLYAISDLLLNKKIVTAAQLKKIILAVDRFDGFADGAYTGEIMPDE